MYPQTIKSMLQLTNHFWFQTNQQLKVRQCANLFYKKYGVIKVISIGRWEWEERGKATFRLQRQDENAPLSISFTTLGISRENMDLHAFSICLLDSQWWGVEFKSWRRCNNGMLLSLPMLSMPSCSQTGHQRESQKAWSQILLSEWGIVIFLIEYMYQPNEKSVISTRPPHSSTSANFLRA